jgi:lipopolysaccharide export system protein LptA
MPRPRWAPALALSALFVFTAASPEPAAVPKGPFGGMQMNGYQIETETTNWNLNSGDFTMPKEVRVTRQGSDARGDRATGNSKRGTATLVGNVVVHDDGGAPEAKEVGKDYSGGGPSTITCDSLTLDSHDHTYDAEGNVKFTQGNRTGTARRGILNQVAHTLHLEGNVVLAEGQTSMRADVVDYNLQSRDVVASGAPMMIKEPIPASSAAAAATPSPKPARRRTL